MKVALYVSGAQYPPEYYRSVSGHVQVALKTAECLAARGHRVTLVTTHAPQHYRIPPIVPLDGVTVEIITQATRPWPSHHSVDIIKAVRQFRELRRLLDRNNYDVIHFVGHSKTAWLLGLIKASGVRAKAMATLISYQKNKKTIFDLIDSRFFAYIDQFVALTAYTRSILLASGFGPVAVAHPGVLRQPPCTQIRPLTIRPEAKGLVLFWRNANIRNGADIAGKIFTKLAVEFEWCDFVFAVRPHDELEQQLQDLSKQYKNIHLFIYPYPDNVTIFNLICSAVCVVLPFRELSMNPQFCVLETLLTGTPLITTSIESNGEIIEHLRTGYLVEPSSVEQTYSAVRYFLENQDHGRSIGERAKARILEQWNWQIYSKELLDIYEQL